MFSGKSLKMKCVCWEWGVRRNTVIDFFVTTIQRNKSGLAEPKNSHLY